MDLTNLRDSLDVSSRERHPASRSAKRSESRLTRDFKAAALQLTTLYRTSLSSDKRSYASGYTQSLHEILDVVMLRLQQNSSSHSGHQSTHARQRSAVESTHEELIWLARYIRARLEAIKAESEDDEDDQESEEEEEEAHVQSSHENEIARDTPSRISRGQMEEITSRAEDEVIEGLTYQDPEAVATIESPSASTFTFLPPSTSTAIFPSPIATTRTSQGQLRRRIKGMPGVSPAAGHMLSAPSISEEEDGNMIGTMPQTPSKQRTSSRLGKRLGGRDKSTALDPFGKSINAKRRRGLGDRRDDERRDGELH